MFESFKLKKLTLFNYRKYASLNLEFSAGATLLIGENGSGKTTVLDGIATLLGGFLHAIQEIPSGERHPIKKHDIKLEITDIDENVTVQYQMPVDIAGTLFINNQSFSINRLRQGLINNTQTQLPKNKNQELVAISQQLTNDQNSILPVISYHGTGRLWEQEYKKSSKMERLTRLDGYKDCLNAKSNYRNFIAWFQKQEKNSFNLRKEIPILELVRRTVIAALNELTQKQVELFIYREGDLEIKFQDEPVREKVSNLSDGYRNIIGIVSDIAYRMAILNPTLGLQVCQKTPGIVLIDEIDLHLHQKWQQKIVGLLQHLFPRVQFIATSHSPFIIQSMTAEALIELNEDCQPLHVDASLMSIEDVAENIQKLHLPQISERKAKMLEAANRYFQLLEQLQQGKTTPEALEAVQRELDQLTEPFEQNMAYVAYLRRKRLIAENKS